MKKILLFFVFCTGTLSAQIVTDRPDQTESSTTVPAGYLQIESGFLTESRSRGLWESRSYAYPNILLRLGLVENLELRVVTQLEGETTRRSDSVVSKTMGMSDTEVGFKYRFVRGNGNFPEISLLSHLSIPNGSAARPDRKPGTVNKIAVTHDLSDKHSLAYNIGYNYFGNGSGDLFYSLAWGISLTGRMGVYAEIYGYYYNMDTWEINTDAGMTYLLADNLQLDYSFGIGLDHTMNYHSLGISLRLPD